MVHERRSDGPDRTAISVLYTQKAEKELDQLDAVTARRIGKKMEWFGEQKNPLAFAKRLSGPYEGRWRFRVGDYRVICRLEKGRIWILWVVSVKHRSQVYRELL